MSSLWEFKTLDPNGKFRQCWDVGGILLLLKDVVFIPLMLVDYTFEASVPILDFSTKFSVIYWALDMVLGFFTGFLVKGNLDMLLEFGGIEGLGEEAAAARFMRFLRLLRMLRLGKASGVGLWDLGV
eukprot:s6608_g2.t1